jgi:hypothetical protein
VQIVRRWNLLVVAGAVTIALIIVAVAQAAPRGWIFGPAPTQANLTFQTDNGFPAFYEVVTSPQIITGLTCPGGAHAVFPFNGNPDIGECGPFPGPGLSTGLIFVTGANPFPCDASFGDQASFDSSTYMAQGSILSLNSCPTTPPTPLFSSHASFQSDLRPQLTKQWNAFVERQLKDSTSLAIGFVQARSTKSGNTITYDPQIWKLYQQQSRPLGAVTFPFEGTIVGPGMVQISIVENVSRGHCAWLTSNKGGFQAGPCGGPIWLPTVSTGDNWSFTDRRALPPGHFVAEVRATDQGQSEQAFGAGTRNMKSISVTLRHK